MTERERCAQYAPYWGTKVTVQRTRSQIERLLAKWGCDRFGWIHDGATGATLTFEVNGRTYAMKARPLPLWDSYLQCADHVATDERALRQAWRAVYYQVKVALETAHWQGIETTLLAHLALSDGRTLGEVAVEDIQRLALPS